MILAYAEREAMEKLLYESIEEFFKSYKKDVQISCSLDRFGYIKVNSSEHFESKIIKEFEELFDFTLAMSSERTLTDFRNVNEIIEIETYQYAFIVNLDKTEEEDEDGD